LQLLPLHLHTERHCIRAVLSNIDNLLHINPIHIDAVIRQALTEGSPHLGGFSYIQDIYNTEIKELIEAINAGTPSISVLKRKSKDPRAVDVIYKHRLSSLDKDQLVQMCKQLNAPNTLKFVYGPDEASVHFPRANKREWLEDDLRL